MTRREVLVSGGAEEDGKKGKFLKYTVVKTFYVLIYFFLIFKLSKCDILLEFFMEIIQHLSLRCLP